MVEIGSRIKDLRHETNLSQNEIARQLGIAQNSYSQIETNKRQPSLELLVKLAKFFHVTTDYILGVEDD